MIEKVKAFDRTLAARIEACAAADRELLVYLRSKAEANEALPAAATLLLLGR